ncbi:DUF378 domain-containing protein [Coralloluteibacterium thermophilus]|uniref:DUF378 domain-containing protein n=1 Tax=Coralloluteibacterium thermophilum TaxID=2707049 RepID=A0ABV9NGE1_9GAMM
MNALNVVCLILVIVGALNWGLVGAFNFDLVAALFGGVPAIQRLVYILVGVAGIVLAIGAFASRPGTHGTTHAGVRH